MSSKNGVEAMAQLAGEVAELAIAGQAIGVQLLLAEMHALQQVMPGTLATASAPDSAQEPVEESDDAFDNMPV